MGISEIKSAIANGDYESAHFKLKTLHDNDKLNYSDIPIYLSVMRKLAKFDQCFRLIDRMDESSLRSREYAKLFESIGDFRASAKHWLAYFKEVKKEGADVKHSEIKRSVRVFIRCSCFYMAARLLDLANSRFPDASFRDLEERVLFYKKSKIFNVFRFSANHVRPSENKEPDLHCVRSPEYIESQSALYHHFMRGFNRYKHGVDIRSYPNKVLENSFILSDPGIIVDSEGFPVADFVQSNAKYINKKTFLERNSFRYIDHDVFFANRLGGTNYYHWLTELLPSFLNIEPGFSPLIFNPTKVQVDSISSLKDLGLIDGKFDIVVSDEPCTLFSRAISYPSYPSYHHLTKSTVEMVEKVKGLIPGVGRAGSYIYSTRNGSRVKNEEVLIEFLKSKGFKIVDNSSLSFIEQCEVYASAEIVVGVHGANLSNCIFMGEGSHVVELMSSRLPNRVFVINSSVFSLNHSLIFSESGTWDFVVDDSAIHYLEYTLKKIGI